MKGMKLVLMIMAATMLTIGLGGVAYAFHSGGVAECEGCHTMHNSYQNAQMTTTFPQFTAGAYLLKGGDQSSTCIECHGETPLGQSYHMVTPDASMPAGTAPGNYTPGGDFGWLKKTYTWIPQSGAATEESKGERKGHNIIAGDFSYVEDVANTKAPGGNYAANKLGCQSCHDPHGKYRRENNTNTFVSSGKPIYASGSYYNAQSGWTANEPTTWGAVGTYRLLGGIGYAPKSYPDYPFLNNVPVAKVNSTYQSSAGEATSQFRVAYGSGMSEWCANCHGLMHNDNNLTSGSMPRHPAGNAAKLTNVAANYNAYVKSGDMSGSQGTSGNTLIPWETGDTTFTQAFAQLAVNSPTFAGPVDGPSTNVQCLSCHRVHASGWNSMLRFPYGNEFMTVAADSAGTPVYPSPSTNPAQAMGRQTGEFQAGLYNRPASQFAPYQRVLCNKCHAKD
jgi:hypothetical protein